MAPEDGMEGKFASLEARVLNMEHVLFGTDGVVAKVSALVDRVTTFISAHDARDSERKEQQEKRDQHMMTAIQLIGILVAIATLVAIGAGSVIAYMTYQSAKHTGAISDAPSYYSSESPLSK